MHENFETSYTKEDGEVMNMGYMMGANYDYSAMPMQIGYGLSSLWLINSVLVSVLLVVLIRYFWMKGGGK